MDKPPESLIVKMFAEIMPEVKFVDVTQENDSDGAGKAKTDLEIKSGKPKRKWPKGLPKIIYK